MRRRSLKVIGLLLAVLVAAQFLGPGVPESQKNSKNRSVWQDPSVPPAVKAILRRSCADCHSVETRWPWYAHIAPVSWLIVSDVRRAQAHFTLSVWPEHPDIEKAEIGDMIVNKMMPPRRYLLLHPDAVLTGADRQIIIQWIQSPEK